MRVRRAAVALLLLAAAAAAAAIVLRGREEPRAAPAAPKPPHRRHQLAASRHRARSPAVLSVRRTGSLAAPVQDGAIAAVDARHALLLGGLTPADTSTDLVRVVTARGDRAAGRLPGALHDAAAVALGRAVYLFGGGNGVAQLDAVLRVPAAGGTPRAVARLPAASSDQAAAGLGGTAYVVGGYTGTRWLDTIVAWRPGARPRVVAHLPTALRYAAVTAAAGRIVIAGGSLPNGAASRAVLAFDPRTNRVQRLGSLPAPTTHAAAAALGGTAYVLGGRGASQGTQTARVVAVDPLTRRIAPAGRLPTPLSDEAAATLGNGILVAGGRSRTATERELLELAPRTRATPTRRLASTNVYAGDAAGDLAPAARAALPRVYVPNSESNTVDVIDPRTFRIVGHFAVGALPQHVTPSWDLRTLYVLNDEGNSITPIDPRTAKPRARIPVTDPYNMYFTPNGRYAIVVAERLHRLDFRNAHTFALHHSLHVPCSGVDHVDFSADGSYFLASCEFSGQVLKVDVARERVVGVLTLPDGAAGMPQDVKLSPDGRVFYVADMHANGLWEVDGDRLRVRGFLHTGAGVHGLYPSRDARLLYATNRGEGTISVISFRTRRVVARWRIPGGSPDMGNVSADGKVLWLSGRYSGEVYALSTRTGRLLAPIRVGSGPHGLCVWPQPGRYSLGHTGILR